MKYLFTFFTVLFFLSVSAQKLYLHDIESGNYKSYYQGDKIEFMTKDSAKVLKGTITSFQNDGFILNDTQQIKLSQIAALVKDGRGGGYTVGSALLIILGSYILLNGAIYTGAGIVVAMVYPEVGVPVAILSAAIGYGGYAIINRQVKKSKTRVMLRKDIDNIHYRLYIE